METKRKATMLLYACCGPCACAVFQAGYPNFYDITIFFYGSHLDTFDEFKRRLGAIGTVNKKLNKDKAMIITPYNSAKYELDGCTEDVRCVLCIDARLRITAQMAREGGYNCFATSLSVSPHKDTRVVNLYGWRNANGKVFFVEMDLKKDNGFQKTVALSKELGLYRQNYCGCGRS